MCSVAQAQLKGWAKKRNTILPCLQWIIKVLNSNVGVAITLVIGRECFCQHKIPSHLTGVEQLISLPLWIPFECHGRILYTSKNHDSVTMDVYIHPYESLFSFTRSFKSFYCGCWKKLFFPFFSTTTRKRLGKQKEAFVRMYIYVYGRSVMIFACIYLIPAIIQTNCAWHSRG